MGRMHTFTIKTLGCKVNQYEAQQTRELLERFGLVAAEPGSSADLVVVHSCCVTAVASAKSRRQVRKSRRSSPGAPILVTGCLGPAASETLRSLPGPVVPVPRREDLPQVLRALLRARSDGSCYASRTAETATFSNRPEKEHKIKDKTPGGPLDGGWSAGPIRRFSGQSRAFLKVQDGCDGFCTYCIIPRIRTRVCNKPVKTAVAEAAGLVAAGHREIVLTGICLGAYGQSTVRRKRWDPARAGAFAELVDRVAQVPGLARLRLSSLEPGDVSEALLEVLGRHSNIMPHLHLPLQSGSDAVLRRMGRQYRMGEFVRTVERVRSVMDRPAITTDIIVGFPGETEADFERSMEVARQVGFAKVHVFGFSLRAGTAAARMDGQVRPAVIRERSERLRGLDADLQAAFRRQFVGEQVSAVLEGGDRPGGRTERYFAVTVDDLEEARIVDGALLTGVLRR